MKVWMALPSFALAACVALPANAGPAEDLARLAKGFEDAALRLQDDSTEVRGIVRWESTIVMAFVNPGIAARQAEGMRKSVREIAAIAGVAVREVDATDPAANFVGKFTDVTVADTRSSCFASTTWQGARILRVDLNVGAGLGHRNDRCVVHEVVHGFGFHSHPHGLDSILSYVYNREGLTPIDRLLVETLYDKRLKPGMTRAVAAPIACRILAEKTGVSAAVAEPICAARGRAVAPTLVWSLSESERP
jgi:hypothetical protein